jgi:hypothetical protein
MDTSPEVLADVQAFSKALTSEDDLGSVVRAHIRIENHLIKLIEQRISAPQQLSRLQLEYDQYVTMALVLGLSPDWVSPLRAMGRLRNGFAHKLDAALDLNAVNGLYESLPSDGKRQVHDSYANIRRENPTVPLPERFGEAGPKDKFQIIAMVLWTRLTAWLIQARAEHGA